MNAKLTLTLEENVVQKAKIYAKEKKRSLSDLFETYLKNLLDEQNGKTELTPNVAKMQGAFKTTEDFDYQKELTEILAKKHL